ncbi:MAG: major capsid protein [Pseudomonadota bacterium]
MSLTLLEAAKLKTDPLQRGVIEVFPRTSPVLERMPFLGVSSDSYKYNREQTLPGIAFRAVGGSYTESTGVINPVTESLAILGGVSDVDRALVKTQGNLNNLRAIHDGLKAKAAALKFTKTFFKGDSETTVTEFDGLQARLTGGQLVAMGSTSGGDTLTLAKLDELIDAVEGGPDVLFMNKTLRRKVNTLVRAANQAIETVSDSFGRQLLAYAGVPIGVIEDDETGTTILGFTEANPGGGSDVGTSVYAVRFGVSEFVCGLQCGELDVIDQGLYSGGVAYRTLIEWITGMAVFHPKSAARLYGIKNA